MNPAHTVKTQTLSKTIKTLFEQNKPFRVFHGSTNSTRVMTFKKDEMVDVSNLNKVLSIDKEKRTAVVEPNVPMDKLVNETLKYGLLPPIVMEFPGITVGGGIQGNGGESSSFKWGAFNQTFNSFEVITPDGNILNLSDTENTDLYKAIPGSAGTLAILTVADINLIPAKKFVQLQYLPVHSFEQVKQTLESYAKTDIDFLDGIMFSKTSGVVIAGTLTDKKQFKLRRFTRAHDQWYYLHAENELSNSPEGWSETVPLKDYLFRYDRGAFWVGRFAFELFDVRYTRFMRWLLNPILHTRKLYQALQESGASQQHVVQDLVLPADKFVEFSNFIDTELNTYPLWLCPMLPDTTSPFQLNNLNTPIINVGVWGANIPNYDDFIHANRQIEQKVLEVGGKKWSYAHSYFTETEFWSMYDKNLYDALRQKYNATSLPDIYKKVTVTTKHPMNNKKAVYRTIFGLAKLKIEK